MFSEREIKVETTYLARCCDSYIQNQNGKSNFLGQTYAPNHHSDDDADFQTKAVLSCCVLTPVDFQLDVVRNTYITIYNWNQNSPAELTSQLLLFGNEQEIVPESNTFNNPNLDFNYSAFNFPNKIWYVREPWEISIKTIAVIPLVIIAILGNLAVIRIILMSKALRKNPVHFFILNMSIADLAYALLFPWIFLISDFYQTFLLGSFICKCEGFVLISLMLASVFTLTVISFDRLVAIVFPLRVRLSPRMARVIMYGIWIVAFAVCVPLAIWRSYMERKWKDYHEAWCTEDVKKLRSYWLVLVTLLVWLPLLVLVISYTSIVIKLDTLEKRQVDQPISQIKHKSKVVRMLFLVVVLFSVCWVPFTVLIFIRYNKTKSSPQEVSKSYRILYFVAHYLMFLNSAINPIIYGLLNDNIKRELLRRGIPSCVKKQNKVEVSVILGNGRIGIVDQAMNLNKTRFQRVAAKYGINLMSTSLMAPSLSAFERRKSALEDLGLPVP